MAWYIKAALGGGFGGTNNVDWQLTTAKTEEEAMSWAYGEAQQEYESYEGSQGLFDTEEYLEENPDATEEDAEAERNEDMESWIDYTAQWFDSDPNEE